MEPKPDTGDRSLKDTIRAIRIDEAERTGVVVALREADLTRLDILHDRLKPVLAEVPGDVDLFDIGVTPGTPPRLWIDMIAFVEMGRDRRSYRFLQDTRNGRRVLVESDDVGTVADRITAYIARRLIERERLLALPAASADPAPALPQPSLPRADMPAAFAAGTGTVAEALPPEAPLPPEALPPPPATAVHPAPGSVRFSGLGAMVIFLIGIAAGVGGIIAFAQLATRL